MNGIIRKPIFCFIVVTKTCFFKCKMCQMWKSTKNPEEVTCEELIDFVKSLRDFVDERILIHLIGGEPLYKDGIIDLISFINKVGFTVSLTSNGYLVDGEMAKRISDSGLTSIFLSLDGAKEETHDFLRGREGSHRKIMGAIENLGKYSPRTRIGVTCTIMEKNLEEIIELTKWVNQNPRLDYIYFNAILQPFDDELMEPEWYKRERYKMIWPQDLYKLDSILDELVMLKEQGYKIDNPLSQLEIFKTYYRNPLKFMRAEISRRGNCPRGDSALEVNSVGDMSLCFKTGAIGNIRNNRIQDVWYEQRTQQMRETIRNCKMECDAVINCPYEVVDRTIQQIEH